MAFSPATTLIDIPDTTKRSELLEWKGSTRHTRNFNEL